MSPFFTDHEQTGLFIGRVWNASVQGPSVVTLRAGRVVDITSKTAAMVRDISEMQDPAAYVQAAVLSQSFTSVTKLTFSLRLRCQARELYKWRCMV